MCNEAYRRMQLHQVREDWSQLRIPLRFPEGLPNFAPLDSIRITDRVEIVRMAAEGPSTSAGQAEMVTRRWSWPGPMGKPVYNYRSEGRSFANRAESGRCVIPVEGFFEFVPAPTDAPKRAPKSKWAFTMAGQAWFGIAGLWRREASLGEGRAGEAWTMLTCEPGPDVAPYHHRQVVVLSPAQCAAWLDDAAPAANFCRPAPAGTLMARQVR